MEHLLGNFGITDFEAEMFLQGHDHLKGIDRIQAKTFWAKEGGVASAISSGP